MHKLRADWIFDGRRLNASAVLLVEDDGTIADLLLPGGETAADGDTEDSDTEYFQGILCPGFINAHCHLELSHMKNMVPKSGGLVDFILQLQRLRNFPEEEVLAAMEQAEKKMLAGGIVAVGDIANSGVSFPLKQKSRLEYHTFLEVFGFDPLKAENILAAALALQAEWAIDAPAPGATAAPGNRSLRAGIVPHAPYSVSQALFDLIAKQAAKSAGPVLLSIHNQESAHEDPFYRDGTGDFKRLYREFGIDLSFYRPYGSRAPAAWLPWLGTSAKKLLVHNTYTTAEDIDLAAQWGDTWWCLCPNANLYIEQRLPDIPLFVEKGLNLVLGTDSLASNDHLSILEEMKTISARFPEVGLEQLLRWATRNAAEFFDWEHLGSFERGKKPGVNLLTGLDNMQPGKDTRVRPLVP